MRYRYEAFGKVQKFVRNLGYKLVLLPLDEAPLNPLWQSSELVTGITLKMCGRCNTTQLHSMNEAYPFIFLTKDK
jgi:hypothetical protein